MLINKVSDYGESIKNIRLSPPNSLGLQSAKYSRKVFYDNLWNEKLVQARGHVFDRDGNIVSRPFDKLFNCGENGAGNDLSDDDLFVAVEKVNGFLGIATYSGLYGWVLSSQGSTTSPHVGMFKELFDMSFIPKKLSIDHTLLFEVVHPSDPHIVEEEPGLYLIGARSISMGYYVWEFALDYHVAYSCSGVKRPNWSVRTLGEIKEKCSDLSFKKEGFVIRKFSDQTPLLKIKGRHYLGHKFLARVKNMDKVRNMVDNPAQHHDEELVKLAQHVLSVPDFFEKEEQDRLEILRKVDYV